jgi:hypothetical protein
MRIFLFCFIFLISLISCESNVKIDGFQKIKINNILKIKTNQLKIIKATIEQQNYDKNNLEKNIKLLWRIKKRLVVFEKEKLTFCLEKENLIKISAKKQLLKKWDLSGRQLNNALIKIDPFGYKSGIYKSLPNTIDLNCKKNAGYNLLMDEIKLTISSIEKYMKKNDS